MRLKNLKCIPLERTSMLVCAWRTETAVWENFERQNTNIMDQLKRSGGRCGGPGDGESHRHKMTSVLGLRLWWRQGRKSCLLIFHQAENSIDNKWLKGLSISILVKLTLSAFNPHYDQENKWKECNLFLIGRKGSDLEGKRTHREHTMVMVKWGKNIRLEQVNSGESSALKVWLEMAKQPWMRCWMGGGESPVCHSAKNDSWMTADRENTFKVWKSVKVWLDRNKNELEKFWENCVYGFKVACVYDVTVSPSELSLRFICEP